MPIKQIIFLIVVFILLLVWILKMIVKNQLREVYAVIWMVVVFCIPVSILFYPFLSRISGFVGFIAPANFSFVVGFILLFVISLHFSLLNSNMQRTLKNTVQKVAILEEEIEKLRENQGINEKYSNNS